MSYDDPKRLRTLKTLLVSQFLTRKRIPWILFALVLMFTSAYSIGRLLAIIGTVSGHIGLSQYSDEIPRLQSEADWWEALAIGLPFLAAFVLGLGAPPSRKYSWFQLYIGRLAASVVGVALISVSSALIIWLISY